MREALEGTAVRRVDGMRAEKMMSQIFDLTEEAIKRLRKLIPDESVQAAADVALSTP